ncbi:hypothetical protein C8F04DRAFT_625556 [Mycena alexandri]|uniref:Uncharacterized protein n=1 Tax=Mycena alexandri TaxID=1745969 RepID=A0AAD6SSX5_9AGAR|nr:hypothetical protein C8F04DRAFT_625556 [Mycena alexandri]
MPSPELKSSPKAPPYNYTPFPAIPDTLRPPRVYNNEQRRPTATTAQPLASHQMTPSDPSVSHPHRASRPAHVTSKSASDPDDGWWWWWWTTDHHDDSRWYHHQCCSGNSYSSGDSACWGRDSNPSCCNGDSSQDCEACAEWCEACTNSCGGSCLDGCADWCACWGECGDCGDFCAASGDCCSARGDCCAACDCASS